MLHSNTLRRSALAVVAATLSIGMMACNKTTTPTTNSVTGVSVTAAKTALTIGETTQATATVSVTGTAAKTVTWTSDNATVASVNATTGVITAKAVGTANISACSTVSGFTTKCGSVKVTVSAATGGTLTTAHINFTKNAGDVTVGGVVYTADTGAAFDGTKGWVEEGSLGGTLVPLNMTGNSRDRTTTNATGTTDVRQTTQINMQCNTPTSGNPCTSGTLTAGAYEYTVVNGKYNVTVSVGDAAGDPSKASTNQDNQNSLHVINVEGVNVVPAFTQTGTANATNFSVKTATVTVTDGLLTVDAKGGKNTKINYIDIVPAP